eukprot:CAMPEP_0115180440 /NCGR_PEP_ID=MMETSP0270-20121206/6921_1 /TAXON_ID=71861 /ORGANISM="Scrippsiella trochoidea, Strain CCMP3099" /LENGTH=131 /DNA_ID=CAMNT_0002593441 /DNA_START=342 /DNA_END=737 /DNA_ORIENTATION=+
MDPGRFQFGPTGLCASLGPSRVDTNRANTSPWLCSCLWRSFSFSWAFFSSSSLRLFSSLSSSSSSMPAKSSFFHLTASNSFRRARTWKSAGSLPPRRAAASNSAASFFASRRVERAGPRTRMSFTRSPFFM